MDQLRGFRGGFNVLCLISREGIAIEINQTAAKEKQGTENIKNF